MNYKVFSVRSLKLHWRHVKSIYLHLHLLNSAGILYIYIYIIVFVTFDLFDKNFLL